MEEASSNQNGTSTADAGDHQAFKAKKRGKNWEWSDSFSLIQLVFEHGKNWDKIMDVMQNEQNRVTHLTESKKLRVHYNGITNPNSKLMKIASKDYIFTPKFKRSEQANEDSKLKGNEQEKEELSKYEEKKRAVEMIRDIESRDALPISPEKNAGLVSPEKKKEEEKKTVVQQVVQQNHVAKAEESTKVKEPKHEEFNKQKEEVNHRKKLDEGLEAIIAHVTENRKMEAQLMELLKLEMEIKKKELDLREQEFQLQKRKFEKLT